MGRRKYTRVGEKCKNAGENKYNHIGLELLEGVKKLHEDIWAETTEKSSYSA